MKLANMSIESPSWACLAQTSSLCCSKMTLQSSLSETSPLTGIVRRVISSNSSITPVGKPTLASMGPVRFQELMEGVLAE
eukprot:CAMPEP_0197648700 /NCGR_PEP_ID=MMETSP1338-20131121/27912_1 /TAXON_ID=43686 ORGANISM="Pelagodinium beii, Strain RCC1491" /NCGR_SAMPLE_ID=MMETSP1338 /ASSEMBLY_ACC=CAM_ASM_000754 /LENGTH=79 /DNA_ID=CAMNT_0043222747 /DNA_START=281 /DNA_END=520 /DNA_ORIENTATION=-